MENQSNVPFKEQIQELYYSYTPVFNEILAGVEKKLKAVLVMPSLPTYKSRIKSFSSYYKKILRQKPKEATESLELVPLTDMIGIRVICAFLEDLDKVEKKICENFKVKEIERKGAQQTFKEFGYESVHILIEIPEDCLQKNSNLKLPEGTVCEIQIRTILQDAWAEVEHELIYKSEFNPFDKPLRRKLASINASLTLADIIFQEIRDYQTRLQGELDSRRNTFYEKADDLTDDLFGYHRIEEPEEEIPEEPAENDNYSQGSIDDLVLSALHAHNTGKLDKAVNIYTEIISRVPETNTTVLSVIYKHRGMAYFAKNEYEKSLYDFKKSVEYDPKGFRSLYYEGIVYSVLNKNEEAIECFDKSLAIDSFQSHVYSRRALAYYNLGEYQKALENLDDAAKLGLEDEDCKALRNKLIKKFDMGM